MSLLGIQKKKTKIEKEGDWNFQAGPVKLRAEFSEKSPQARGTICRLTPTPTPETFF